MTTTSPRLRVDLQATPVEDADGVLYYDVSDPKTGSSLRLFDFEWLLAQRIDGQHSFDELARWTEAELGFATSRADLEVYAERLQQLGLVVQGPASAAAPAVARPVAQPEPLPVAPSLAPPPARVETPAPEPARVPPPSSTSADGDDGLMGRPVISLPASRPQPAKVTPPAEAKPAAAATQSKPAKPAPEPVVSRSPLHDALEGLPAPVEAPPAVAPAQPESAQAATANVFSGQPTALLEQISKPSESKTIPIEPVASPSAATPVKTTPAAPVEASAQTPVKPPVSVDVVVAPVVKPAEPVKTTEPVKAPEPVKTPEPVVKPVEPPVVEKKSSAGTWIVLLLLLAVAAAAAYYFVVYKPKLTPPALPVQVTVAKVEDVPRTFSTPAEVRKAEPQVLKIQGDGVVTKVAAENDEVAAEAVLVVLDSQAKLEKELAELKTRVDQLQKKNEAAKGKAKQDNQIKIDEKQARIGEVEGLIKKAQLVAPRAGVVTKVLVKVGDTVAAGAEAVSVTDKSLAAEIKVPALEVQGLKVGQEVKLSSPAAPIAAQVVSQKLDGEIATLVFSLPVDAAVKVGDKLGLQRGVVEKAVRLPASAIVEGNKVYVAQDGKATLRTVTVADRETDTVLLQGLASGDQVIVSRPPELHEGAAVQAGAAAAPSATSP